MGNVCCTGRTNHTLHHSPQGSETNLSKKNSEQSFHINKKTLKKSESPKQPFVAYE